MANEYFTPVQFAKEKNVVFLYARITFDKNGAPALDALNSKGFCNVWQKTPTFTGSLMTGSNTTVGTVSSFQGLFTGMNLTISSSLAISATTTLASITATTDTFKISQSPDFAIDGATFTAGSAGGGTGQYILQLGPAINRLSTYYKLLQVQHSFDLTTGSAVGTATQAQIVPAATGMLLIQDNTRTKTIPPTAATNSTDATITVQFGTGFGVNFRSGVPAPGEAVRIGLVFGNSSAI